MNGCFLLAGHQDPFFFLVIVIFVGVMTSLGIMRTIKFFREEYK